MFDRLRDRRHDRHESASLALAGVILALLFAAFPLGLGEVMGAREAPAASATGPGRGRERDVLTVSFATRECGVGGGTITTRAAVGSGEARGIECSRGRHDASLAQ